MDADIGTKLEFGEKEEKLDIDLETMPLEDLGEMVLKEDEDPGKVKRDKRITSRDIRCPLCGEVTRGRRGLNMHLRRTHFSHDERRTGTSTMAKALGNKTRKDWSRERFDPRNELKIQKVLVNAVFGSSKVKEAEDGYVSGKYTMKTLPIDISYYLRLKGVKPERKDQDDSPKEDPKIQAPAPHEVSVSELLDWLGKTPDDGFGTWSDTKFGLKLGKDSYQYVVDLNVDVSDKVLKITSGNDEGSMLKATDAIRFLNKMIEDETLDPAWKVIHGRSHIRKVVQKTDGGRRWLVLDPGSDEEEK